ncbi:MAG: hemolysin family protein [Prevotella sp.]|nr:hemolysin family protein [Prevotella sp.]
MLLLIMFLMGAMSISFLCSILESVLLSTPMSFVTMKEDEGYKPATLFKKYKSDNSRAIASILSLNTIAHTIGAAGVGQQSSIVFGSEWFGLVSAITTVLILIFTEIIPKTLGTENWRSLMGFTAKTIRVLIFLLYPVVVASQWLTRLISRKKDGETAVSREEVAAMADMGEDEGVIDEEENKIIQNVIKLDSVKACDVMTPRVVAATAPETMTMKEFYEKKEFKNFSRIPVYAERDDFLTGYVLRNDVLSMLTEDQMDKTLNELKRKIFLVNEETSVADVWDSMLRNKEQLAGIIDEYGSFQGIITLEDIIETIFGLEIIDEYDEVSDMQQYARERWKQRQQNYKEINFEKPKTNSDQPSV